MDILWAPEKGTCGICGCEGSVRRFTCDGRVHAYCFACWNGDQSEQGGQIGYVMSSHDWDEDETLVFRYRGAPDGATQGAVLD